MAPRAAGCCSHDTALASSTPQPPTTHGQYWRRKSDTAMSTSVDSGRSARMRSNISVNFGNTPTSTKTTVAKEKNTRNAG